MARLQVLNGKRQGQVFEIAPAAEYVIGHRQSATISIDDPWVSWDHARVYWNGDGSCWIEDLGSTNGTYVNCVRVKRERLKHEDIVFLGKTHVIFLSPADAPAAPGGFGDPSSFGVSDAHVLASPSSGGGVTGASSLGPGPVPALRDPFASTGNQPGYAGSRRKDPFADSSVDPFASGPDYASGGYPSTGAPAGAARPARGPQGKTTQKRAMADTHGDEDPSSRSSGSAPRRSLNLSDLQEASGIKLPGPSTHEISQLIDGHEPGGPQLGPPADARRARAAGREPSTLGPAEVIELGGRRMAPSEMRTRPLDTNDALRYLLEAEQAPPAVPAPPPPPPPATGRFPAGRPQVPQAPAPPQAAPPVPAARSEEPTEFGAVTPEQAGAAAQERARLQEEVHRLRGALNVARQQNPDAINRAAAALRDQELNRLSLRVAELERELGQARAELAGLRRELDAVTEEMIDKEDTIESLRDEVSRLGGAVPAPQGSEDDLRALEF